MSTFLPATFLQSLPDWLWPNTGNFQKETANAFVDANDAAGFPADGACRIIPQTQQEVIGAYQTDRQYTDRALLRDYYPRVDSSFFFEGTYSNGEKVLFDVLDVLHHEDPLRTTLLLRRHGKDRD